MLLHRRSPDKTLQTQSILITLFLKILKTQSFSMSTVMSLYPFCLFMILIKFSITSMSYKNVDIRLELYTAAFYYAGLLSEILSSFRLHLGNNSH